MRSHRVFVLASMLAVLAPPAVMAQTAAPQNIAPPAQQAPAKSATTAQPAAKPAAAAKQPVRAATAPAARTLPAGTLTTTPTATARPIPREQPTALGRILTPDGSLGFETRTSMSAYDLDGRGRVPGFDNIHRNDTSYYGLSLRSRLHAPN